MHSPPKPGGALRPRAAFAAIALSLLLAACGGGGGAPVNEFPQAPVISAQPAPLTVVAGSPATFSALATGAGLRYQWQRDGVNIAGATASSYTLPAAQLADDGSRWSVVVTAGGLSVASSAAVLNVKAPPPAGPPAGGLALVAGGLGGAGNADGPVGRFNGPRVIAVNAAGVVHVEQNGRVRTLGDSGGGAYIAATKPWPMPYDFNYMVQDSRFIDSLNHYSAIAFDAAGNLIGLYGNHLIKVTPNGVQSNIAGADAPGDADGAGAAARFNTPLALALGQDGTIYVADYGNARIRTVSPAGLVATHAAATAALARAGGGASAPRTLAVDSAGNLYIGDGQQVHKVTPTGAASSFAMPSNFSLVADRAGNVYSTGSCRILKATGAGVVTILVGNPGDAPGADQGNVYVCSQYLAIGQDDSLYIADADKSTVRKLSPGGVMTTIGGMAPQEGTQDGVGADARLAYAEEIGADGAGNIYVKQSGGAMRKVSRAGVVTTLNLALTHASGAGIQYYTGALAFNGSLVASVNLALFRVDAQGTLTPLAGKPGGGPVTDGAPAQATFGFIESVARDGLGNTYVIDTHTPYTAGNDAGAWQGTRIRKITPAGVVSTVLAVATDPDAEIPFRLAADKDGNLYVTTTKGPVLRIAANGSQSRIVTGTTGQRSIAVDNAGNAYVAGYVSATRNYVVEKISPTGQVGIIAGRPGSIGVIAAPAAASLGFVGVLTVDGDGTVYVFSENAVLRVVQ